jgi:hypothetical protein
MTNAETVFALRKDTLGVKRARPAFKYHIAVKPGIIAATASLSKRVIHSATQLNPVLEFLSIAPPVTIIAASVFAEPQATAGAMF